MSPRSPTKTEHEIWTTGKLGTGELYLTGSVRKGIQNITCRVMPDFGADENGYLWGVIVPGYRPSKPKPLPDDPKARYWKPPRPTQRFGGRCTSLEDGQRKCNEVLAKHGVEIWQ